MNGTGGGGGGRSSSPTSGRDYDSLHRFLLLPSHVPIILLLEFLNSFRSFGLRFVLYNYVTNEYGGDENGGGVTDSSAGASEYFFLACEFIFIIIY